MPNGRINVATRHQIRIAKEAFKYPPWAAGMTNAQAVKVLREKAGWSDRKLASHMKKSGLTDSAIRQLLALKNPRSATAKFRFKKGDLVTVKKRLLTVPGSPSAVVSPGNVATVIKSEELDVPKGIKVTLRMKDGSIFTARPGSLKRLDRSKRNPQAKRKRKVPLEKVTQRDIEHHIRDHLSGTKRRITPNAMFLLLRKDPFFAKMTRPQFKKAWDALVEDAYLLPAGGGTYVWEYTVGGKNPIRKRRGRIIVEEGVKVRKFAPKTAFDPRSFRTIKQRKGHLIIGCPVGGWDAKKKKCRVGTRAHKFVYGPVKSNPQPTLSAATLRKFRQIHGTNPDRLEVIDDGTDRELVALGNVTALEYRIPFRSRRSGRKTTWRHKFKKPAKLCLTAKGEPVILFHGSHKVTRKGLEG